MRLECSPGRECSIREWPEGLRRARALRRRSRHGVSTVCSVIEAVLICTLGHSPWNAPGVLTQRAFVQPLLAGNTVILKTSEMSPKTQMVYAKLVRHSRSKALLLVLTRRCSSWTLDCLLACSTLSTSHPPTPPRPSRLSSPTPPSASVRADLRRSEASD